MKHHTGTTYSAILGALAATICVTLVILGLCIGSLWLSTRPKSKLEMLWPLTTSQRRCAEQIIGTSDLIYADKLGESESVAIGYTSGASYYVSIFNVARDEQCSIEFQEEVWNCYKHMNNVFCDDSEYSYRLLPKSVEYVDLTDNESPEVHVWVDSLPGKYGGAFHVFYIRVSSL